MVVPYTHTAEQKAGPGQLRAQRWWRSSRNLSQNAKPWSQVLPHALSVPLTPPNCPLAQGMLGLSDRTTLALESLIHACSDSLQVPCQCESRVCMAQPAERFLGPLAWCLGLWSVQLLPAQMSGGVVAML